MEKSLVEIKKEVNLQLGDKETMDTLVLTTFKGLQPQIMKRAIMEGMMRGYTFKDFLEKNVYAIPFRDGYSLVTSIDHARKIGMRSGVVGKSAPEYKEDKDGKIISCTVTIKRKVGEHIGDYSAMVFFNEYTTGKNLWTQKPRTMLAKVAEMHALRMACPEELSQAYVEEEGASEMIKEKTEIDISEYEKQIDCTESLEELHTAWANLPVEAKNDKGLIKLKDELKVKFTKKEKAPKKETKHEDK